MVKKGLTKNLVWVGVMSLIMLLATSPYAQNMCTPSITELAPNLGPSWIIVTLTGERFGGERQNGDAVLVGSEKAPIYSWSDTLIRFRVPVGLSSGVYNVAVKKAADPLTGCGAETSNQVPFEVTESPGINAIDPAESTCGEEVNVYGKGFGLKQEEVNEGGFGYSTYVELYASADQYRITKYPDGWLSTGHIKILLHKLFDVNTGSEVPDKQLYHGTWTLKVITDYFIDDGDGIFNLGLNGLDPDDEILYTARSNAITLELTPCNLPPVANAGSDFNVATGESSILDGSESYDPEGVTITFLWMVVEVPFGSAVSDSSLSDVTSAKPAFAPDVDGTYKFALTVSDGVLTDEDDVAIFAITPNVAPNADAGADQNVITGTQVELDGSGSNDPDDGPEVLSYLWSFDSVPMGSTLTDDDITNRNQVNASFTPDVDGTYVLRLTVSDGDLGSEDTVEIMGTTLNVVPSANAGDDITVSLGEPTILDGSGSDDPDDGPMPLSYSWSFVAVPAASQIRNEDILGIETVSPSFMPDLAGTYVLELMVSDGQDYAYDNVAVTVVEAVLPGDLDGDGQICRSDLSILLAAGNTPADGPDDPRDLDGDGMITALDARKLVTICTRPRCACN